MPALIITTGSEAGRRIELTATRVTIGRHSSNTIAVADDRASRHHAEIELSNGHHILRDLGSGNGTLVNGQPVQDSPLNPGDEITIGDTVLRFVHDPASIQTTILRTVPESEGRRSLGVLYDVAAAVGGILNIDELLNRILELAQRAISFEHAVILLHDTGTGELMPRAQIGEAAFSRTIIDHALRERQGLLVSDAGADVRFAGGESIARHNLREVIAAPMRGRHESVGALLLSSSHPFAAEHLELAVAIAHQAALAVEESRYHRALLDAERLAAVGQTIAGMGHHIKNILQGLRFGGDMIRTGLGGDDRELIAKGWRLVEKNQSRIETLIQDMLSYSKEREPVKEPCDLKDLVREVMELVSGPATARGTTIETDLADVPKANVDSEAMHAAILNVIGNAIDAVENGIIKVTLGYDGRHRLTIDDSGTGIPPEQRESVFEPFVSSKGVRGTGLGLPVSRKICREHGGDLTIEDSPLGGARFVFTI